MSNFSEKKSSLGLYIKILAGVTGVIMAVVALLNVDVIKKWAGIEPPKEQFEIWKAIGKKSDQEITEKSILSLAKELKEVRKEVRDNSISIAKQEGRNIAVAAKPIDYIQQHQFKIEPWGEGDKLIYILRRVGTVELFFESKLHGVCHAKHDPKVDIYKYEHPKNSGQWHRCLQKDNVLPSF